MVIFLKFILLFFPILWDYLIFIEIKIVNEFKGMEHVDVLRLQYMLDNTLFFVSIYIECCLKNK